MNILIVDREEVTAQMIRSKIEPLGHQVTWEQSKGTAVDFIASRDFDVIYIDPSPFNDAHQTVLKLRRTVGYYPYIVVLSGSIGLDDAIKSGANAALSKPVNDEALGLSISNAAYMLELIKRFGDDSSDFPSAGGVIAKSAFNQVFLSSMERANRYGERAFILLIAIQNYQQILELDGAYAADFVVAKLSSYLVQLRRQSDLIGQTARNEYALMLQRPIYDTEPVEAANRFAEALSKYGDIVSSGTTDVDISVTLSELPVGTRVVSHVVRPQV